MSTLLRRHDSPCLSFPATEVTKATQRSVIAVLERRQRPLPALFALLVPLLPGGAAGVGEEWLFRRVLQTALGGVLSGDTALAVSSTPSLWCTPCM